MSDAIDKILDDLYAEFSERQSERLFEERMIERENAFAMASTFTTL